MKKNNLIEFLENNNKLDDEERMSMLTDAIHFLYRGASNGFHAHKEAHLTDRKHLEYILKEIYDLNSYNDTRYLFDYIEENKLFEKYLGKSL